MLSLLTKTPNGYTLDLNEAVSVISGTSPQQVQFNLFPITEDKYTTYEITPYTGSTGLSLGVSCDSLSGEGYKGKGLYLGDINLSDGGALIEGNWKPHKSQYEGMRVSAKRNKDTISVIYEAKIEGAWYSLGEAFDIDVVTKFADRGVQSGEAWYGSLRLSKPDASALVSKSITSLDITISTPDTPPSKMRTIPVRKMDDIEGVFRSTKFHYGPELGQMTGVNETIFLTATIEKAGESTYHISMAVETSTNDRGNRGNGTITISGSPPVYKASCSHIASTRMMAHPLIAGIENKYFEIVGGVTEIVVEKDGSLLLKTISATVNGEIEFKRSSPPTPKVITH